MDSTIYQKNDLAHSYVRASRFRDRFKDAFDPGDRILIYGCGIIGRGFYHDTKDVLNIIGFIDNGFRNIAGNNPEINEMSPSLYTYDGMPVYSLQRDIVRLKELSSDKSLKILVTPMWAWEAIRRDVEKVMGADVAVLPLYQVFAFAELEMGSAVGDNEREFLRKLRETRQFPFPAIGHFPIQHKGYSLLLYLLYNKNWKDTCFIFDSAFSQEIIESLRAMGCICFQDRPGSDEGAAFDCLLRYIVAFMPPKTKYYGEDHNFLGMKHFLHCEIHVIEDRWGADYEAKDWYDFTDLGTNYLTRGFDDRVKELLVTEEVRTLPQELRQKATSIYVKAMWEQKSEEEKQEILSVFGTTEKGILESWKWGNSKYESNFFRENKFLNGLRLFVEEYDKNKFEERWAQLKTKYKSIRVFKFCCDVLGDSLLLYHYIIHNEALNDPNILNVFLPFMDQLSQIHNKAVIDILRQTIYIPEADDLPFWSYVYKRHLNELDVSRIDYYGYVGNGLTYEVAPYDHPFIFSEAQEKATLTRIKDMQITQPFACFVARSSLYYGRTVGKETDTYSFRNMEFRDYFLTGDFLKEKGIYPIRMGRSEDPIKEKHSFVDYAGNYANDYLDVYLTSHCKFIVCNSTGFFMFASLFHIPILMVNVAPWSFGLQNCQYTLFDLFIPQKYYDTKKGRRLSFREMIPIEKECRANGAYYERKGIQFERNSPEEIRMATAELLDRIEGRWKDSEVDIENYRRYREIYNEYMKHPHGVPIPYRPSATYLRANPYLLD